MRTHSKEFCRVLRLSKTMVTELDNQGISIGVWFIGWPVDRIAHIYSSKHEGAQSSLHGAEYRMGVGERRFGSLLRILKRQNPVEKTTLVKSSNSGRSGFLAWLRSVRNNFRKWSISSGLVDLVFQPRISAELDEFIQAFSPDVLHAQTTDLGLMAMAVKIADRYKIPICLHVLDDYPNVLYRESPFARWLRPMVEKRFNKVLELSSGFLTPCDAMAKEYRIRYQKPFHPIYYGDDWDRHQKSVPERLDSEGVRTIVYCGSLYLNRWKGILDVARVAEGLDSEGFRIRVHVYAPQIPFEAQAAFKSQGNLVIHDIPPHDAVPSVMKGADILLLPESFDRQVAAFTRLSLSSKVQLMMASQRPVLVYGPPGLGTIEYAREWGWGAVVDSAGDVELLKRTIRRLLEDAGMVREMVENGRRCFEHNHRTDVMVPRFRELLCQCANFRGTL